MLRSQFVALNARESVSKAWTCICRFVRSIVMCRRDNESRKRFLMSARLDSVAHYICQLGGWNVSNLQLQKLIYMAQMVHMGRNGGKRLVNTEFQAWDYGPVSADLYAKVRMFGAGPIKNVFFSARPFKPDDPRKAILDEVCGELLACRPGQLVDITHWKHGAWAINYVPGIKGNVISDADIASEYWQRTAGQHQRNGATNSGPG